MKKNKKDTQFRVIIGVDLGDTKHAICVTDKQGNIRSEYKLGRVDKSIIDPSR